MSCSIMGHGSWMQGFKPVAAYRINREKSRSCSSRWYHTGVMPFCRTAQAVNAVFPCPAPAVTTVRRFLVNAFRMPANRGEINKSGWMGMDSLDASMCSLVISQLGRGWIQGQWNKTAGPGNHLPGPSDQRPGDRQGRAAKGRPQKR